MKRSVTLLLLTITVLIVLIFAEVYIIRKGAGYDDVISVLCAAENINEGAEIREGMLIPLNIPSEYGIGAINGNSDDYIGKYASCPLHKGEILYENNFSSYAKAKTEGNVLIAVDLKGDQANGWWIDEDQLVDLMVSFSGGRKGIETLKDVRIAALLDDAGNKIEPSEPGGRKAAAPRYVSLEVSYEQAIILADAKQDGKVNIIVR